MLLVEYLVLDIDYSYASNDLIVRLARAHCFKCYS